jgi:hypothetical protein
MFQQSACRSVEEENGSDEYLQLLLTSSADISIQFACGSLISSHPHCFLTLKIVLDVALSP